MLSVSRLVNVTVNLSPVAAQGRTFGVLMIAGDSNVISGAQRIRSYQQLTDVANDFGVLAPEYLAAQSYFNQVPKPAQCMVGRWLRTASAGFNQGGILTAAQQALANFTGISNGGFHITIDGVVKTLNSLDFSAVTNLNGVATVINGALTGGVASWNGSEFIVTSNTTGAGVKASGTITFTGNPAPSDTLTVDGTAITFVASSPIGNQVVIGATAALTLANLLTFLQQSADANINLATYSASGLIITVLYKVVGTGGNAFTLAESGAAISLSGGTLASGAIASTVGYATAASGTDISALLQLSAATSLALVSGYASETPVQCATALAGLSTAWYGLTFAASVQPTNAQALTVASFIEGQTVTRIYGVTVQDTSAKSSLVMNDLGSLFKSSGYNQSFTQYSTLNAYAVCSLFGREFTVDFTQSNTAITLMFKQEPGTMPEDLTNDEANVLQAKNYNVFAAYINNTSIIQYGVMASGVPIDEIHGLDWFQDAVQTASYNVLYTSTTKIPQTDAGVNQITNSIQAVCEQAVANGLAAPGIWNAAGFGTLTTGQYLKTGFYLYAQPIALQSQADRAARKGPPIQIALKLAGAIQQLTIAINVNQ